MDLLINFIYSKIIKYNFFIVEIVKYNIKKKKLHDLLKIKKPLISILLPTFNRSRILKERAVRSVLSQSYKNYELIIIDDGSTDDTEETINKIKDKRIKYIKIKRNNKRYPNTIENHWFVGPVVALNKGLDLVKGDWIARIDDDDIWTRNHLKDLLQHLKKKKKEFVSSDYLEIRNGKKKIVRPTLKDKNYGLGHIGGIQTWMYASYLSFFKYNINSWRKKMNRVNDTDMQERFMSVGIKICYLNKVTCIIKPRPNEKQIGIKAYLENEKKFLKKYNYNLASFTKNSLLS